MYCIRILRVDWIKVDHTWKGDIAVVFALSFCFRFHKKLLQFDSDTV